MTELCGMTVESAGMTEACIDRTNTEMTLNIALVGAGGMGMRHATGYIELREVL